MNNMSATVLCLGVNLGLTDMTYVQRTFANTVGGSGAYRCLYVIKCLLVLTEPPQNLYLFLIISFLTVFAFWFCRPTPCKQ